MSWMVEHNTHDLNQYVRSDAAAHHAMEVLHGASPQYLKTMIQSIYNESTPSANVKHADKPRVDFQEDDVAWPLQSGRYLGNGVHIRILHTFENKPQNILVLQNGAIIYQREMDFKGVVSSLIDGLEPHKTTAVCVELGNPQHIMTMVLEESQTKRKLGDFIRLFRNFGVKTQPVQFKRYPLGGIDLCMIDDTYLMILSKSHRPLQVPVDSSVV
jgi:hypothetical protein